MTNERLEQKIETDKVKLIARPLCSYGRSWFPGFGVNHQINIYFEFNGSNTAFEQANYALNGEATPNIRTRLPRKVPQKAYITQAGVFRGPGFDWESTYQEEENAVACASAPYYDSNRVKLDPQDLPEIQNRAREYLKKLSSEANSKIEFRMLKPIFYTQRKSQPIKPRVNWKNKFLNLFHFGSTGLIGWT